MSWRISFTLVLLFGLSALANSSPLVDNSNDIVGRWDLSVGEGATAYPSWLEVTRKDGKLAGRFVGRVGSARPIKQIEFAKSGLSFSLPPQYERMKTDLSFSGNLSDSGVLLRG